MKKLILSAFIAILLINPMSAVMAPVQCADCRRNTPNGEAWCGDCRPPLMCSCNNCDICVFLVVVTEPPETTTLPETTTTPELTTLPETLSETTTTPELTSEPPEVYSPAGNPATPEFAEFTERVDIFMATITGFLVLVVAVLVFKGLYGFFKIFF